MRAQLLEHQGPRPNLGLLQAALTSVVGKLHLLEGALHHSGGLEVRGRFSDVRVTGGHD